MEVPTNLENRNYFRPDVLGNFYKEYASYRKKVPMLIPFFRRNKTQDTKPDAAAVDA